MCRGCIGKPSWYHHNYAFKKKNSLEKRKKEAERIIKKYPQRIPVVCEKKHQQNVMDLETKFLVPNDLTMGQFTYVIRKRIKLKPEEALFLFHQENNAMPSSNMLVSQFYKDNKDEDGFLYLTVAAQETFG